MTGEQQTVGAKSSPAHEVAIEIMIAERLDAFELGLTNLADATRRRLDDLSGKIDKVLTALGVGED